ncbi:MAG: Clp1/GlmU family protein [Candidatus Aquicultor sp.]
MNQWIEFKEIPQVLVGEQRGLVFLLGGPDVGKSTLIRRITEAYLREGHAVGLVDGDVGQSSIGPPATIGMTIIRETLPEDYPVQALYFVGDTNPVRRMLEVCTGSGIMAGKAHEAGTQVVLFDSSGLIAPPYGVALKYNKLALLRPDIVIAIEKEDELAPVLSWLGGCWGTTMLRTRPPVAARPVSARRRTALRQEQYRRYFQDAVMQAIPVQGLSLYPAGFLSAKVNPSGLMVGLQGEGWNTVAVGIIETLGDEVVSVFAPRPHVPVCGLAAGGLRLSKEGVELGRVHPREFY